MLARRIPPCNTNPRNDAFASQPQPDCRKLRRYDTPSLRVNKCPTKCYPQLIGDHLSKRCHLGQVLPQSDRASATNPRFGEPTESNSQRQILDKLPALVQRANGSHNPPPGCGKEPPLESWLKAREAADLHADRAVGFMRWLARPPLAAKG